MALLLGGIAFDAHEVSLRDTAPEMLALSPKGSVPVMLLPDGKVLEQSWDIMHWALDRPATRHWWTEAQTAENLEWLTKNDGFFKHHLDRYKYPERYDEADRNSHREQALAAFLRPLACRLGKSRFLGGVSPVQPMSPSFRSSGSSPQWRRTGLHNSRCQRCSHGWQTGYQAFCSCTVCTNSPAKQPLAFPCLIARHRSAGIKGSQSRISPWLPACGITN